MQQFPALRSKCTQLSRYSTNFTGEIANAGTAITVAYQAPVSASVWTTTANYASADETISSQTVTLQEPFYVQFYLSPNELKSYGEDYLKNRMAVAAIGVIDEVRKKVLNLFTGATIATVATISASAHNFNTVLSASNVLMDSGSQGAISFLAPSIPYSALLVDAKASGYNVSNTVVEGQEVFQYGPATVVREAGVLTAPVATTQDAAAIALRLPEPMEAYQRTLFADDVTGATVAVDIFQSPDTGRVIGRAHVCAGWSLGRPGAVAKFTNL